MSLAGAQLEMSLAGAQIERSLKVAGTQIQGSLKSQQMMLEIQNPELLFHKETSAALNIVPHAHLYFRNVPNKDQHHWNAEHQL